MGLENDSNVKNIVLNLFLEVNRFTKYVNRFTTETEAFLFNFSLCKSIDPTHQSIYTSSACDIFMSL